MLKLYTDASTKGNPGPSGGGIVLIEDGQQTQLTHPLAVMTNHEAEFAILDYALAYLLAQEKQEQTLFIYTDSKIVATSLEKNFAKNPEFMPYVRRISTKMKQFNTCFLEWIPESQNKGADHLARQALQKILKNQ